MHSPQEDVAVTLLNLQHQDSKPLPGLERLARRASIALLVITTAFSCAALGQSKLPFEVSNPRNQKWPVEQAGRIYVSACDLLARTIRPEKPPELRPKFLLVLGSDSDEYVRMGAQVEIRLKSWSSPKFAEAVVMIASREVLQDDDLKNIVRQSLSLSRASVSVSELRKSW